MSRRFIITVTLLLLLAVALPVSAARRSGIAFTVSCIGFTTHAGALVLDRDNTGAGRERFQIIAQDGSGTTIYSGPVESFYVGGTVSFPEIRTTFSAAPSANPIIVSVVSAAGNALPEQVVYSASGRCANLPDADVESTDISGVTSPSVPPNVLPPVGSNSDATISAQSGHLVVNTAFLNLRSGDGPEYTIVGRVSGGDKLVVLGRNDDTSWWYVRAGDIVGWAITDHLVARGDLRGTPVIIPVGEIALPRLFLYADAVLRSTSVANSPALCTVAGNLEYEVVGRNANLTAVKVSAVCDGAATEGWLAVNLGALRNPAQIGIPVTN